MSKRLTTPQFIKRAIKIHGDKYDYSRVDYLSKTVKIVIICPDHGGFEQSPDNHIQGKGCKKCAIKLRSKHRTFNTHQFIKRAIKTHGDKYDYSLTNYSHSLEKVKIICHDHGIFSQLPSDHVYGQGCKKCSVSGFNVDKPAFLYYLKIGNVFKIGVTNRSVNKRYSSIDLSKIEIINQWHYNSGKDAYDIEQYILKHYKNFKYKGLPILESGNSELFNKDILGLVG